MHTCRAKCCTIQCPNHILMCKPHWSMVPKDIQREVYSAWKDYNNTVANTSNKDFAQIRLRYLLAVKSAVDVVAVKEGK